MKAKQQDLPFPKGRGGKRRGAGRKRKSAKRNVPHRRRRKFRKAALHVTVRVRMARALNNVMRRRGAVFADRYHAHLLATPTEAARAVNYVIDNWRVHALREGWRTTEGVDPWCSESWRDVLPPLIAQPRWWMLCVGLKRAA